MVLSVAIGIGVLTTTVAVMARLVTPNLQDDTILTTPIAKNTAIPLNHLDEVQAVPDARLVMYAAAGIQATDGARFVFDVLGFSDAFPEEMDPSWMKIDPADAEPWRSDRSGAIVGADVMRGMGWQVGQTVTVAVDKLKQPGVLNDSNRDVTFKIIGVVSEGLRINAVGVHYKYLEERYKLGGATFVHIKTSPAKLAAIAKAVDDRFNASGTPTVSQAIKDFAESTFKLISAVPQLLSRIGLLVVLITGLLTASTLAMALKERRAEFATLFALGYRRRRILAMIMLESLVICLCGGVLGAVVPYALYHRIGINMGPWVLNNVAVTGEACVIGLVAAVVLSVIVSVLPAAAMARQDVVTAMKGG